LAVASSLTPETVVPRLRGRFGHPYVFVDVCPSTQRLLGDEHSEGAVALTEEQTEGRGRLGRPWLSPPGVSLLFSLLLEPPVQTARLPELTLVAGQACAQAIAHVTNLTPEIKLPNDILIGGRKSAPDLPQGIEPPATSLLLESGSEVDRVELLVELLDRLERAYDNWVAATGT
jgi:BirA family biotin operon repressor/biotin-[acetyl-CoA-carboxylase] ligase